MADNGAGAALLNRLLMKEGGLHKAHLQIADRCNHACVHCYQVQGEKGELSAEQTLRALDRLRAAGVFLVTISGGEATLRADFLDIVAHARALGMAVTIYTNGYTLTDELARALAALGVWRVHVSLYAATADKHDAITRVPGSWQRTVDGVASLRRHGLHVVLKMPVMQANHGEVPAVRALARSLGCSFGTSEEITAREDGVVDAGTLNLTREEVVEHQRVEGDLLSFAPEELARIRQGSTCGVGRTGLVVEPNGELRACTALPLPLGNVLRDDPKDVVASEEFAFLGGLRVSSLHGCRDCDLIPGCTRCHANALYETGDALGPYASACGRALAKYEATVGRPVEVLPPVEAARPNGLGPFRIEGVGVLRQLPDEVTPADEALVREHGWIRQESPYFQERVRAGMGEPLVQLRVRRPAPRTVQAG